VGGDIVRESFLVILAGVVFALALAFGLAGKDWAKAQIERWWPRQIKDAKAPPSVTTVNSSSPTRFDNDRPPR
jgi:hypothetical protein